LGGRATFGFDDRSIQLNNTEDNGCRQDETADKVPDSFLHALISLLQAEHNARGFALPLAVYKPRARGLPDLSGR
jgi:hypothetical protein